MKKYLTLIILCSLCLGFAACGNDDKEEEEVIVPEKFVWNGDWNDPAHPKYDGYYNPLEGDWVKIDDYKRRFIFTKDFVFKEALYIDKKNTWEIRIITNKYSINDIGYKYRWSTSLYITLEYKFVIESGQRYLMIRQLAFSLTPNTEWMKFKASA